MQPFDYGNLLFTGQQYKVSDNIDNFESYVTTRL